MSTRSRLLLLAAACGITACGSVKSNSTDAPQGQIDAPASSMFTLTVTKSGNSTGTVASNPSGIDCGATCSMQVAAGTQVVLTPTPDANGVFGGWTGGGCSGTGPCTVTVNANTMVDAAFTKQQFTVTVTPNGDGTGHITSAPTGVDCGVSCSSKFDVGTQVTLTATADSGSSFTGWTGGGCTGTGTCVITLAADTTVQATFAKNNSLVVTLGGNGSGTVASTDGNINCGTNCSHQYTPGTVVTLNASPDVSSTFTGWSGGGCSGAGACIVTISAATQVTATFTLKQFTLTVTKTGNGAASSTVTSTDSTINCGTTCTATRNYGDMVTLNATAGTGITFNGWSGGGCSGTGSCVVTVSAATTVTANFTLNQYTLTATLAGTGSGTVKSTDNNITCPGTCSHTYNYGSTVTLNATASGGSAFTGWSGGCTGTGSCVVTIAAATTVTATFQPTYTLTVAKTGIGADNGTVTSAPSGINCGGTCSAVFTSGTVITLTATMANGATFAGWSGGGCSGTGTCVVTIAAATSVTANFGCPGSGVASYGYTGTQLSYTVPACVTHLHLEAYGAQGLNPKGGLGGYAKGDLTTTGGTVLTVRVGGQALFNGGGAGQRDTSPGNGGDASDIRMGGTGLGNRILVAGGGGGAMLNADVGDYPGGAGGGGTCGSNYCGGGGGQGFGDSGATPPIPGNGQPGAVTGGAGVTAPHSGGAGGGGFTSGGGHACESYYQPTTCGANGSLGQGGAGDNSRQMPSCYSMYGGTAGGGGGYYGGGGTSVGFCGGGGGGGGSSYTGSLAAPVMTAGVQSGVGKIVITPF